MKRFNYTQTTCTIIRKRPDKAITIKVFLGFFPKCFLILF